MTGTESERGEGMQTATSPFVPFSNRFANAGVEFFLIVFALGVVAQPLIDRVPEPLGPPLLLLAVAAYCAAFWASPLRATPVQLLGRLRVIGRDGAPLSPARACLRAVVLFVLVAGALAVVGTPLHPLLWLVVVPAWAGLFLAAVTRRRQALHDLAVGSVVVKARELDRLLEQPDGLSILERGIPLGDLPRVHAVGGLLRDGLVVALVLFVLATTAGVAHDRNLLARVAYAVEEASGLQRAVEAFHLEHDRLPVDAAELGTGSRTAYPDGGYYELDGQGAIVIRFTVIEALKPVVVRLEPELADGRLGWRCSAEGHRRRAHLPGHCRP